MTTTSTVHPDRSLISSEDVEGTTVYTVDGTEVGEVDHLMIDKSSGQIGYAVISFGGFLGLGHSHYPIPWRKLSYSQDLGGYRTDITENQLRDSPKFSDDSWSSRDWEEKVHTYYGTRPYWG